MITVKINGAEAVPAIGSSVTVTYENPFLKDRDAWSMEIPFPLNIKTNIDIFGNINRLDVKRKPMLFKECEMYAKGKLVIKGVGRVTSVTNKEVRVQIKSGIQGIAYRSDFEDIYIDEIPYDDGECTKINDLNVPIGDRLTDARGRWAFPLVYDESQDEFLNVPLLRMIPINREDDSIELYRVNRYHEVENPTVQPSLKFVLSQVFKHLGYSMGYGISNGEGSDELGGAVGTRADLFICSNTVGLSVAAALPHWTVKRFLDEIRSLLNITFLFDDENGKVGIRANHPEEQEKVSYECLDEFTSNYMEKGEEYIGSSNLQYNLSESSYQEVCEDISEEVLEQFELREYSSRREMLEAINAMGYEQSMKKVFRCPDGWYYVRNDGDSHALCRVVFQHLRRKVGDDTLTLNITPVPMGLVYHPKLAFIHRNYTVDAEDVINSEDANTIARWFETLWNRDDVMVSSYIPCITSERHTSNTGTVQEAVEDNATLDKEEEERLMVMYIADSVEEQTFIFEGDIQVVDGTVAHRGLQWTRPAVSPILDTAVLRSSTERMAFYRYEKGVPYIGDLHDIKRSMENAVQVVVKYLDEDVPRPYKIHVFKNKLYLCDKIEANITDEGIGKVKTGYFYEIGNE